MGPEGVSVKVRELKHLKSLTIYRLLVIESQIYRKHLERTASKKSLHLLTSPLIS